MSAKTADVVIVGSGIVGSAAAYYLQKKGMSCIVLESGDIIGNGASCRNGGGVRVSSRDEREIPLAKYAVENIWPTLGEELEEEIEYERSGNLRFAKSEKEIGILEGVQKTNRKYGLEMEMMYGGDKVREFCPYCSDDVSAALWCTIDGHANPLRTTLGFYKMARRLGAAYYTGEKVVRLGTVRGRAKKVFTENGNVYEGDSVIVAAGYGTRAIANTVGVDMPFRQKLIEMFVTEQAPPMFSFMMSAPAGFYGHQTEHGSFVFGGDSGYEHHPEFRADAYNIAPTAPAIARGVMQFFPKLGELKIIRTWAGWIDLCQDLVPVIGPVKEAEGLYIAAGYSAHGFCLGPVSGKMLSELAAGEEPCVDWRPLRYDRFVSCQ